MTIDDTALRRHCVLLNCSRPAVDPDRGRVHCAAHDPNPPPPPRNATGQDPDTQMPPATTDLPSEAPSRPPDPSELEPWWDGTQWVLRPAKRHTTVPCPHCGGQLELIIAP